VSVTSVMRHVPGTRTLSVRFTLLQRLPGEAAQTVTDGDLGQWLTPADPTLGRRDADVWKLAKSVSDVDAPASYRFRVAFRWEGADGRVLARRHLETRSCALRELRPDVLVRGVTVRPVAGHPRRDRYAVLVANRGRTASGPFSVQFTARVGGTPQTAAVASLGPGAHARLSFRGPVCDAESPPTVVADPTDQVDDYDRSNNTFSVRCPTAAEPLGAS
jgi:hypothetical protein